MKFPNLPSYYRRASKGQRKDDRLPAESAAQSISHPISEPTNQHPQIEVIPPPEEPVNQVTKPNSLEEAKSKIDRQSRSLFFNSLPSEIRNQIYEDFVWSSQSFCPVCESRHFVVCQGSLIPEDISHHSSILSLLLVCRRLYFEIVDILYSSTTFHLPGLYNIRRFLSTIPFSQHQNIRSLQLTIRLGHKFIKPDGAVTKRHRPDHPWRLYEIDWINIWRLISTLRNLQNLRVTFLRYGHSDRRMFEEFPPNNPEKISAQSIFEPMMAAHTTLKQNFVVEIHSSIFKRDRAFTRFLDDLEESERSLRNDGVIAQEGSSTDVTGVYMIETKPPPPFVVRKLVAPRDPSAEFEEGMEYGSYRVWHAPPGKYSKGLQEDHVKERWGDPEDRDVLGSFRSDRCRVGVV